MSIDQGAEGVAVELRIGHRLGYPVQLGRDRGERRERVQHPGGVGLQLVAAASFNALTRSSRRLDDPTAVADS